MDVQCGEQTRRAMAAVLELLAFCEAGAGRFGRVDAGCGLHLGLFVHRAPEHPGADRDRDRRHRWPCLVERHGIEYQSLQPLLDAFGRGDVAGAVELCTPELAEKLSIAGTPEECAEKVQRDILPTGINHIIACITDPHLVKVFTGQDVGGVPDAKGQLQLIHDEVFPLLGVAV